MSFISLENKTDTTTSLNNVIQSTKGSLKQSKVSNMTNPENPFPPGSDNCMGCCFAVSAVAIAILCIVGGVALMVTGGLLFGLSSNIAVITAGLDLMYAGSSLIAAFLILGIGAGGTCCTINCAA